MRNAFGFISLLTCALLLATTLLARPSIRLSSTVVRPGDTLRVTVDGVTAREKLAADWMSKKVQSFPLQPGAQRILLGVPLGTPSREETLHIWKQVQGGSETVAAMQVTIASRTYPTENVNFSPKTTALMRAERRESRIIGRLKFTVSPVQLWKGPFVPPVKGPVIGEYGVHRLRNGNIDAGYHKGVDLRARTGTPLLAANAGRVLLSANFVAHGKTVMIDHGQGIASIYLHMNRLRVKKGQYVRKGERIGDVGSTGLSTAPHVHWQIYVQGVPVDPAAWLVDEF